MLAGIQRGGRILEAGHYYAAHGPTAWAVQGWKHLQQLWQPGDQTMLFVDDLHAIEDVPVDERSRPVVHFEPDPMPDHLIGEYSLPVRQAAEEIFQSLNERSPIKPRCRARDGATILNGKHGTVLKWPDGQASCVLLDAGLTLVKQRLGFSRGINILPVHYGYQQEKLRHILGLALPTFELEVLLFDFQTVWTLGQHSFADRVLAAV